MSDEVRGLSTNRYLQNSHGDVNYSIGNGDNKELIHMTHGHELSRGRILEGMGATGWRVAKGENGTTVVRNQYNIFFKNTSKIQR